MYNIMYIKLVYSYLDSMINFRVILHIFLGEMRSMCNEKQSTAPD